MTQYDDNIRMVMNHKTSTHPSFYLLYIFFWLTHYISWITFVLIFSHWHNKWKISITRPFNNTNTLTAVSQSSYPSMYPLFYPLFLLFSFGECDFNMKVVFSDWNKTNQFFWDALNEGRILRLAQQSHFFPRRRTHQLCTGSVSVAMSYPFSYFFFSQGDPMLEHIWPKVLRMTGNHVTGFL